VIDDLRHGPADEADAVRIRTATALISVMSDNFILAPPGAQTESVLAALTRWKDGGAIPKPDGAGAARARLTPNTARGMTVSGYGQAVADAALLLAGESAGSRRSPRSAERRAVIDTEVLGRLEPPREKLNKPAMCVAT
jgi:hypothetical protein